MGKDLQIYVIIYIYIRNYIYICVFILKVPHILRHKLEYL